MLKILYQDPAIVVCEKPFRVLSTDEPGGMPDCIRQALGRPEAEVRTVHRLDQVVGGLMVYALTPQAASDLSRQIRENRFLKEYLAVIHWRPREEEGTFLDLLGRNPKTRKTYVAKLPGKGIQQAVLHYRVVDSRQGFSLVSIRLETGWTHQIRAQFSSPGPPPGGGPEVQQVPRSPRVADRPVVPPPGLYPPGDRPGHGFPVGSPWGGGLGFFSTREGEGPCWTGAGPDLQRGFPPGPGRGSRLSLEKARTQRVAGVTPRPPALRAARSHLPFWRLWCIVSVDGLLRVPCTCPDLETFFCKILFQHIFYSKMRPKSVLAYRRK